MWSCSHRWCFTFQVPLLSLLFDLVQRGSWLLGCCDRLLCPVIQQFVKIISKSASLVVAVVGLDLSKSCDWLGRRWGCGCGEWGLWLTGGWLSSGGAERRPWKDKGFNNLYTKKTQHKTKKGTVNQLAAVSRKVRSFSHKERIMSLVY